MFTTATALHVDCNYIKRNFYAACNTVLCKCEYADEFVKLALIKYGNWLFAGMTVEFFDTTDGSQSLSCNICVVNYRLHVYNDLRRWNFLSDMQSNSINSAIEINDDCIDILRDKYGGHGRSRCSRKALARHYLAVVNTRYILHYITYRCLRWPK